MGWCSRRNGSNGANDPQKTPELHFNPNDRKYNTICCHVKTAAIIVAVMEAIALVVAVTFVVKVLSVISHTEDIPEGRMSYAGQHPQSQNRLPGRMHHPHRKLHHYSVGRLKSHWLHQFLTGESQPAMKYVMSKSILFVTLIDAALVCMLLHGICKQKWGFLIPYLVVSLFSIIASIAGVLTTAVLLGNQGAGVENFGYYYGKPLSCTIFWIIKNVYFVWVIFRCTKYFKDRSEALRNDAVNHGIRVVMPLSGIKYVVSAEEGIGTSYTVDGVARDGMEHQVAPDAPPLYQEAVAQGLYPSLPVDVPEKMEKD